MTSRNICLSTALGIFLIFTFGYVSAEQIQLIIDWIDAGAKDN